MSRALRLYPTFWAAVAVTFTVVGVFGLPERAASPHDAFLNLTMIPTSLGAHVVDGVYWTLERELRFYGLVLLLVVVRSSSRHTVHALLITVAVQTVGSAFPVVPHWASDLLNAGWAHLFACGAILARARRAPSWEAFVLLALCLASSHLLGAVPFTYGAGAVALVWIVTRPFVGAPVRLLRPLLFLGKISYPLYLVHQNIGYVVMRALCSRGVTWCGDSFGMRRRARGRDGPACCRRGAVPRASAAQAATADSVDPTDVGAARVNA